MQWGPLGITAEYIGTLANTPFGSVYYQGGYAQAAYRLTGEHRAYDKKTGTLGKLVPYTDFIPLKQDGICGWGAWEVAARWSMIDLRNPDFLDGHYYNSATNTFTTTSKAGNGVLQDTTLGITWFLNTYTKIQANWIHAMLDNEVRGPSTADLSSAASKWIIKYCPLASVSGTGCRLRGQPRKSASHLKKDP